MNKIDLAGQWQLRGLNRDMSVPIAVPGDTHSALLAAEKIPDPYYADHELGMQWIGREDWCFERTFEVSAEVLAPSSVFLHCESLDTLATIYLNGRVAGVSNNQFVRRRFEVKDLLRVGSNEIRIEFASAENAAVAAAKELDHALPHNQMMVQSPHRNLIRKCQCHSGWDWGPCLMVSGIYGEIYLGATSLGRIEYVTTEQTHGVEGVEVEVRVEVESPAGGATHLEISLDGQEISLLVELRSGLTLLRHTVHITAPKLWWPAGSGEQPLYDLTVRVAGDSVNKRLGLRTVVLENRRDEHGISMTVIVNGVPIFCKGANYIPTDALPLRQTRAVAEQLLRSALWANMNMIRVWGGGLYEPDWFYDFCDEHGLLVWQDFMFACALYPADKAFLASVREEARHQVKRLQDHPSLALWCGNNENIGALRWYPESIARRDLYVTEYDRLNEGVLGNSVRELDPTCPWWPSSPCGGPGDYTNCWDIDRIGDMHYWSVWFLSGPVENYRTIVPRFQSEFGFQGFPSMETIRSFAAPDQWNFSSPIMEHHQRNDFGMQRITETFTRYYRFPEGFENMVYLSQVLHAYAMQVGVEHWRRLRPVCMGALYWMLNDNWPAMSGASIEYGGKWKLLHYAARRFFAPRLVSVYQHEGKVQVWVTNDERRAVAGPVRLRIFDWAGRCLHTLALDGSVGEGRPANSRSIRWRNSRRNRPGFSCCSNGRLMA